jgi:AcrR family transcriptional regulator
MPKAFSEHEKETIRAQMREKGKKLFEKQGLKKTSVDELTEAVSISKGAFYLFYDSKEELFLEILEELEIDFRSGIFNFSISPKDNARSLLAKLLKSALLTWDRYPLLKNFGMTDYEYLARKLPLIGFRLMRIKTTSLLVTLSRNQARRYCRESYRGDFQSDEELVLSACIGTNWEKIDYAETMEVLSDLVAAYIVEGHDGIAIKQTIFQNSVVKFTQWTQSTCASSAERSTAFSDPTARAKRRPSVRCWA